MRCWVFVVLVIASIVASGVAEENEKKKHHHRRHHHKHHLAKATGTGHDISRAAHAQLGVTHDRKVEKSGVKSTTPAAKVNNNKHQQAGNIAAKSEEEIVNKMRALEKELGAKEKEAKLSPGGQGQLEVNGPLPINFPKEFADNVAKATGSKASEVRVLSTNKVQGVPGDVEEVHFAASPRVVADVEDQASDPESKLAMGALHNFLVAKEDGNTEEEPAEVDDVSEKEETSETPVKDDAIDIDTAMPYGELEPFGREDTAQELTEQSVKESDEMVDQLERAEVAEEKRAVFRALTRLRGAAITSFDGIARSQTGNIDEYNKIHKWRRTHPLHHLADEESDISKWAFPDNADF